MQTRLRVISFQSLGNHEFDDGMDGLVPFLDNVTFPILAANLDTSGEPSMDGKVLPSVVITKGGRQIGIVGYVTTETKVSHSLLLLKPFFTECWTVPST